MWFKLDDGLPDLPEYLQIPRRHRFAAVGVWSVCGSWVSKHLTNGFVPNHVLEELGVTTLIRGHLVACGLWREDDRGGIEYTLVGCRVPDAQAVTNARAAGARRAATYRSNQRNSSDLGRKEDVTPLRETEVTRDDGIGVGNGDGSNHLSSKAELLRKSGTALAPSIAARDAVAAAVPINLRHNGRTRRGLEEQVAELINDGADPADIDAGLREWVTRPDAYPGHLPHIVTEVSKRRNGTELRGADKKAAEWQALKGRFQE